MRVSNPSSMLPSAMMAALMAALVCAASVPQRVQAQALLPSATWGTGPIFSAWSFSTPLRQSSGDVQAAIEVALPFRVSFAGSGFRVDLTGAGAYGGVVFKDAAGDGHLSSIAGPTDVKLRVSRTVFDQATLITLGVNLPTGKTKLNSEETSALQILAAPSLAMPIASFGLGTGATLGVVHAFQGDGWAFALGASGEKRSEYSPVALVLQNGLSETKLTPGFAAHVTAGYDRTVGEGRFSALLIGDVYTRDQIRVANLATDTSNNYTLGPQLTGTVQYDFGTTGWRQSAFNVGARMRTEYADATGKKVAGSSGSYLESAFNAVRGGPEGAGFVIGADARYQTGLKFTDAMIGAAMSGVGLTLGFDHAGESTSTRLTLHGMYGSFDTGKSKSTGVGVTLGFSIGARRGAQ